LPREVTVNPRFGRRSWVKLWVNEWLDGTTRFEMSDAQRAFWIDLLAMAGRSRFPGIVCAGQIDGKFVGYPLSKYQSLMAKPIDVEQTFKLFERTGKIVVEVTSETPVRLYKVSLCNWTKFQSEYQRQKPYRLHGKLQPSDQPSDEQSNNTEVEVEVEGETEVENPQNQSPDPTSLEWTKAQLKARSENRHESAGQRRSRRNQEAADSVV